MHRGLIITKFNPLAYQADAFLVNLIRNSTNQFDIYDGDPVDFATWAGTYANIQGEGNNIISSENFASAMPLWQVHAVEYYNNHSDQYDFIVSWLSEPECYQAALQIKSEHPEVKWVAFFSDNDAPDFSGADVCRNAGLLEVRALASSLNQVTKQDNPFIVSEYAKREYLSLRGKLRVSLSPMRIAKKYLWDKGFEICEAYKKKLDSTYVEVRKMANQVLVLPNCDGSLEGERVITPGYDKKLFHADQAKATDGTLKTPLRFVCYDTLDNQGRRLKSFIGALRELKTQDPELSTKFHLDFYGRIKKRDLMQIAEQNISDLITVHQPKISYADKLATIEQADWGVIIDENISRKAESSKAFPLGILEYFGARKPVFAVTSYIGTTAEIIEKTGGGLVVTHSASEIAMYLAKIIYQEYQAPAYREEALKSYNLRSTAEQFDQVIEGLF